MGKLSRVVLIALGVAWLASLASGCGRIIESLQQEEVAVAVLVATPDLPNPATGQTIAGVTSLVVYFGQLDLGETDSETGGYTPLAGATVRLQFTDAQGAARDLVVPDVGDGTYELDSISAPALTYAQVDYTLRISRGGETWIMKVRAPAPSDIAEIAAAPGRVVADHAAGTAFRVTRSNVQGAEDNDVAFVTLSAVEGETSALAWSNVPDDATGFIDLLLRDAAWRADSFVVPGTELNRGAYVVSLAPMARGLQVTSGGGAPFFFGSSFFAGIAAGGSIVVP